MTLVEASACDLSSQQTTVDVVLLVLSSVFVLFMFVDAWIAFKVVSNSQVDSAAQAART